MNTRRCTKIAARMNALLVQALGQGIDPARMLNETLYARDVLLVCDALQGTGLPELAQLFRQAQQAADAAHEETGAQPSGFSPSRFLNSLFGPSTSSPASTLDGPGTTAEPAKRPGWLSRLRDGGK
jgi:hypothetical protein